MNFKVEFKGILIILSTDTEDPDKSTEVTLKAQVEGGIKSQIESMAIALISESAGFYGHGIDRVATSNADLSAALLKIQAFKIIDVPEIAPKALPDRALS